MTYGSRRPYRNMTANETGSQIAEFLGYTRLRFTSTARMRFPIRYPPKAIVRPRRACKVASLVGNRTEAASRA
jgi:hypothetical protein